MTAGRRARMLALGAVAVVVVVGLYLLFVRTGFGQRFDDLAMEGRKATDLGVRRFATRVMSLGTRALLPVAVVVLAMLAVHRQRWRDALTAAAALVVAGLLSRLLKGELPRVDLLERSNVGPENSFPSGHSALAMALALVAVWLSPPEHRRRVQIVASCAVVAHTMAVLGSGWHRPSDSLAGFAVATAVVALAISCGSAESHERPSSRANHLARSELAALMAGVLVVSTAALVLIRGAPNPAHHFAAYLVSVLATNLAALVIVHLVASGLGPQGTPADLPLRSG